MSQKFLSGEYSYKKHELISAFIFQENGKFEFYYVYGASDRSAKGTYSIIGDTLKLKSDKIPGQDFKILKASHGKKDQVEIKIHGPNKNLISAVFCYCLNGDNSQEFRSNQDGLIVIPNPDCQELYLEHKYFPDYPTLIKDNKNQHNYFEVEMQASLVQFSFKGIDFTISENKLSCLPNYLIPFEGIEFVKSN